MSTYAIRPAHSGDLDNVLELRRHAESWLHERGIDQWTVSQRGVDSIRANVTAGEAHVIEHDGEFVGSVTVGGADRDFWVPEEDGPALYLYKFMLYSNVRGTGLGDAVLDWACDVAERQGLPWLRIDVWRTNTALHDYYLRRGFEYVRTETVPNRNSGALFQRPSTLRLAKPGRVVLADTPSAGESPSEKEIRNTP